MDYTGPPVQLLRILTMYSWKSFVKTLLNPNCISTVCMEFCISNTPWIVSWKAAEGAPAPTGSTHSRSSLSIVKFTVIQNYSQDLYTRYFFIKYLPSPTPPFLEWRVIYWSKACKPSGQCVLLSGGSQGFSFLEKPLELFFFQLFEKNIPTHLPWFSRSSLPSDKVAHPPRLTAGSCIYLFQRQFYLVPVFSFPPQPGSSLPQPSLLTVSSVKPCDACPGPCSARRRAARPGFQSGSALQKLGGQEAK